MLWQKLITNGSRSGDLRLLDDVFNPSSNGSWAIARQYTYTQYWYTNDRNPTSHTTMMQNINSQLQQLAVKYKLEKMK
jgi:hypothetical protein